MPRVKHLLLITALVIAFSVSGLATFHAVQAHTRITTDLTWSEHVRPILRDKCMQCHHPGGMAPDYVDLTVYGTDTEPGARAWAVAIEEEILTGRMPPWNPDKRFGEFHNTKRLTQEEEDIIIGWVRGGAPQGPERDLPPPREVIKRTWRFGEPDLVLEMPEPEIVPADEQYASAAVTLPVDIEEDQWITGYEFLPGDAKNIRRITAFIHDAEGFEPEPLELEVQLAYDPLADEDELEQTRLRDMPEGPHFLGQWTRGDQPVLFPDAAARLLRAGSTIELQIQYERPQYADWSEEIRDQSKLGLFLAAPDEEIDLLVEGQRASKDGFVVPAGSTDHRETLTWTAPENVNIFGIHPRVGPVTKTLEVKVNYPDGLGQTLIWIPDYRHHFASSYFLSQPIEAPAGTELVFTATYDNSADNWGNPYSPPQDISAGDAPTDERLTAWVDYTLGDHLIFEVPLDPALFAQLEEDRQGGMSILAGGLTPGEKSPVAPGVDIEIPSVLTLEALKEQATADAHGIWWCPMRGNPCRLIDYTAPGECEDCWMELRPKAEFFEGKELAPDMTDWTLTTVGQEEIYWCPNRGMANHTLQDYYSPGACPIDGVPLVHKARFEAKHTYTCLTQTCERFKDIFYGPGLCPSCGQPVAGMGHMDHTPVHGGWQFFMADNLYHHLEGTMPSEGEFRLYFYDDWKTPLDPRNFAGKAIIEHVDDESGAITDEVIPLEYETEGDMWLTAEIPYDLPVTFYTKVWLGGEEKRYDFQFDELTQEPEPTEQPQDIRLHSHVREPVTIPATTGGIIEEILRRDESLQLLIEAEDWYGLHYPAFDAKEFVAALDEPGRLEGLNVRQRGTVSQAIGAINRGALALDRAGDVADAARVQRGYATFKEGVDMLKQIWPNVTP